MEIRRVSREGILVKTESFPDYARIQEAGQHRMMNMGVVLQSNLTPELIEEGNAREFVHKIQNLRKETGLEVSDRIRIHVDLTDSLWDAIEKNREYVKNTY